jgi:hypothetical protein
MCASNEASIPLKCGTCKLLVKHDLKPHSPEVRQTLWNALLEWDEGQKVRIVSLTKKWAARTHMDDLAQAEPPCAPPSPPVTPKRCLFIYRSSFQSAHPSQYCALLDDDPSSGEVSPIDNVVKHIIQHEINTDNDNQKDLSRILKKSQDIMMR